MSQTKTMTGKDPECTLFNCPHKVELSTALDEIAMLEQKNQQLNQQIETIENLISQGLTDFKGLITEIVKDKFKPEEIEQITKAVSKSFDSQKITDIVNENLALRKALRSSELKIIETNNALQIKAQQLESLEVTIKAREEKDLELIKRLRNTGQEADKQLKEFSLNARKIKEQELHLKMLEDFTAKARVDIAEHKNIKEELIKETKDLKTDWEITSKLSHNPNYKPKEVKRLLTLCKRIKGLKTKGNGLRSLLLRQTPDKMYFKVKTLYFGLSQKEKELCSDKYDEIARLMGE